MKTTLGANRSGIRVLPDTVSVPRQGTMLSQLDNL